MDYIKKTYTDKAIEVQISSFAGKGGVTEYHVLLTITDRTLPFSGQLQNIQRAYVAVIQEVLPDDATAVFRRYFLSDAANQADLVMVWECENSYCPLSIVEQAPLNGSKIAMWTWFQTGITVETTKNGMSKAKHNRYTQYWTGGSCNRASNSEYQTRLLLNDYVLQLTEQGCKLANDCIRTWFFVQNVDVNYAGVGIIVKPGGQLSLQKHHHRAEHWVVVEGTAEITVGDKVLLYHEDQSTYIPLGTVHRLKNPGMIPLVIIEIQSGTYLGEDDIVRLEDSYGR